MAPEEEGSLGLEYVTCGPGAKLQGSATALFVLVSLCFRPEEPAVEPSLHGRDACNLQSPSGQEEVAPSGREVTRLGLVEAMSPPSQPLAKCPDHVRDESPP